MYVIRYVFVSMWNGKDSPAACNGGDIWKNLKIKMLPL